MTASPSKKPQSNDEWREWANYVLLTLDKHDKEVEELKTKCHMIADCKGFGDRLIVIEQEQARHHGFTKRISDLEHTAEKVTPIEATVKDLDRFKIRVETRTTTIAAIVSAGITIALFIIDKVT